MTGKGSKPRPFSVPREIFDLRYDIAFKPMSDAERQAAKDKLHELEWEWARKNYPHLWGNKNENTSD